LYFKRKSIFLAFLLLIGAILGYFIFSHHKDPIERIETENLALGHPVKVSSNANLAPILVNGQEAPNVSWHTSWDPPQSPATPSWVIIDLGKIQSIQKLLITFSVAAYDGIYDIWAPPKSIVIEVGNSQDTMQSIKVIPAHEIPENGACPDKRRLDVQLEKSQSARYVKLVFPDGGKLPIMPNVVGLAEIDVYGPKSQPIPKQQTILEGKFGRVLVDVNSPQVTDIYLREPNGNLAERPLLATTIRGVTLAEAEDRKIYYRQGAYTYVSGKTGTRFESRRSKTHTFKVLTDENGKAKKIIITGIRPQSEAGVLGPLEEDWVLELNSEGKLSWTIHQRWLEKFTVDISATPAFYLARFGGYAAYRDRRVDPADPEISSTIWYDPSHLKSGTHADYETSTMAGATEYRTHTIDIPDTWGIYKLFTNFHLKSDLLLAVKGGYLFRRAGVRNDFSEIGATTSSDLHYERMPKDQATLTLLLAPVDKFSTGQQLSVEVPDKALADALKDLNASVLNGSVISDPKRYDFGNGSEDVNYAGSADFQARALSVNIPVGVLAEHPYSADQAFKGHLENILATVNNEGLACFGFNANCQMIDDNLHVVSAAKTYAVKTGDIAFIKQHYATFNSMIAFFINRLDKSNGLFKSPGNGAHWYYDGISFSGFNTYYQVFLYQALLDLAEMSDMLGNKTAGQLYRNQAVQLKKAINNFLWFPTAPNGPGYADWIDDSGKPAFYFIDMAQYPLIAFGVAPHDRAEAMLATADNRMELLKKEHGYTRNASLSLLWPLAPARGEQCFGTYFYGGSVLASTYWEIVARARAGHVNGEWGAYRLLQNFAKQFAQTSFVGSNSIDIRGNISLGGDEGYLSDMVLVPAALFHGLLGVDLNWKKITVTPKMPSDWKHANLSLIWKGKLYDIAIQDKQVDIKPHKKY
jgi:hypothetical protein